MTIVLSTDKGKRKLHETSIQMNSDGIELLTKNQTTLSSALIVHCASSKTESDINVQIQSRSSNKKY